MDHTKTEPVFVTGFVELHEGIPVPFRCVLNIEIREFRIVHGKSVVMPGRGDHSRVLPNTSGNGMAASDGSGKSILAPPGQHLARL